MAAAPMRYAAAVVEFGKNCNQAEQREQGAKNTTGDKHAHVSGRSASRQLTASNRSSSCTHCCSAVSKLPRDRRGALGLLRGLEGGEVADRIGGEIVNARVQAQDAGPRWRTRRGAHVTRPQVRGGASLTLRMSSAQSASSCTSKAAPSGLRVADSRSCAWAITPSSANQVVSSRCN